MRVIVALFNFKKVVEETTSVLPSKKKLVYTGLCIMGYAYDISYIPQSWKDFMQIVLIFSDHRLEEMRLSFIYCHLSN